MERRLINPETLAEPRGFNHGILVRGGRLLFLSGQDASDGAGHVVAPGDLVGQFAQALRNLAAVVTAAGGTPAEIAQITIFVRDRDDYAANLKPLGRVFREHFGGHYPATALFEVSGFFNPEALVEIQGIGVLSEEE
ncbi:MAG TPA: RidA family protein [Ktedonobacterales bacterium]